MDSVLGYSHHAMASAARPEGIVEFNVPLDT